MHSCKNNALSCKNSKQGLGRFLNLKAFSLKAIANKLQIITQNSQALIDKNINGYKSVNAYNKTSIGNSSLCCSNIGNSSLGYSNLRTSNLSNTKRTLSAGCDGSLTATALLAAATLITLALPFTAQANGNLNFHSQGITTGQSSNHHSLFSGIHNPAMGELVLAPDEKYRMAYFMSASTANEVGQIDNFVDEIDELIDILDDAANAGDIPVNETLGQFNRVIAQAGEEGYLKSTQGVYVPPFPFYWRPDFLSGTLTFEISLEAQIHASILSDELIYDDQKETFSTATSTYLKSGTQKKLALSYSQAAYNNLWGTKDTTLLLGGRINVYELELSKQVFQLELLRGKDIEDVIEDEYKNNRIRSISVGLDLGAVWSAPNYRLGASLRNLNSPSFDYGAVGINCDRLAEGSNSQSNCYIADYFARIKGDINAREEHKKNAVVTVDGSYFISPQWLISGAMELNNYNDTVGEKNQWVHASSSYQPKNFFVPGIRLSYSQNLAGSKLSYAGLGLTFGKVVSLDFNVSLDQVVIDNKKAPRGFGIALSFEEWF